MKCLFLALLIGVLSLVGGRADAQVTVTNFDSSGNQLIHVDTSGNQIDAHQGVILQVGTCPGASCMIYWYGDSYGCGFAWQVNTTPWCGFNIYKSPDFIHWTFVGKPFDPTTATWQNRCAPSAGNFGCYDFHVAFNAANNNYVAWVNDVTAPASYRVLISSSPEGPFVEQTAPSMNGNAYAAPGTFTGDEDLFVDGSGVGWIVFPAANTSGSWTELVIAQLNSTYTDINTTVSIFTINRKEAVGIFQHGSTFYLTYGPQCGFCAGGVATQYATSSSLPGTWTDSGTSLNANSCSGQPDRTSVLTIGGSPVYLYWTDLFYGNMNEAAANYFFVPLTFTGTAINSFSCVQNFTLALTNVPVNRTPFLDQSSGTDGFQWKCVNTDLGASGVERLQTFVPANNGSVGTVTVGLAQNQQNCNAGSCPAPNGNIVGQLVTVTGGVPGTTLATSTVAASSATWNNGAVTFTFNQPVTAGTTYGVVVSETSNTQGCFGYSFSTQNPYPSGIERVSTNSGSTWTTDSNTALQFQVFDQQIIGSAGARTLH